MRKLQSDIQVELTVSEDDAHHVAAEISTVHALRRRWKPIKEGPASSETHEPIRIRLHRCFSWMQRVEQITEAKLVTDDARLVYAWIALNALYGRWNTDDRQPESDRASLEMFTRRVERNDHDGVLLDLITEHDKLLQALVSDEYLASIYWQTLSEDDARRANNAVHRYRECRRDHRVRAAIDMVLERVYLARCQLVHGAATFDSQLNRAAVRRSATFMQHLLPAVCKVIIDHCWDADWGGLCYPPQR